jgi:glycolate oxidase iron-sulfur subunit
MKLDQMLQFGNFNPIDAPNYDQIVHCMRCGLCLPTCPTYALYHQEKASPRGRLALMRAVSQGYLDVSGGFVEAINLCLGCLACQTACPAGVPYGHLLERARKQAENHQKEKRSPLLNWFRNMLLQRLVYSPHDLENWLPIIRLYQKCGLHRLNLARLLPGAIGDWERMLPTVSDKSASQVLGEFVHAKPPKRGRVGLLTGCLENSLLSKICIATARVLSINGFDVIIPKHQVCCGALPAHVGDLEIAREQARENIDVFEAAETQVVISDAAGCSAQLKEYGQLLEDDPIYRERARRFARKSRDATEFLAEYLPLREDMYPHPLRVAFDDPCHLIHSQGIHLQPRELIRGIPGVELIELPESSWCCGSAGTYNLTHRREAESLLERKLGHLRDLRVDAVATANTGCYIQLAAGIHKHRMEVQVVHIMELIARAYDERIA